MTETIKQAKLVQYLSEAYAKEKELETALEADISVTTRKPYEKRLRAHLKETRSHASELQRRIKKLGGGGPQLVEKVAGPAVGKAKALAKGPLHAVRGTGAAEKMLEEREDPVLQRARGDRHLHGDRDPRRERRRRRHREARPGDPPRRGADGEVPRDADPGADQGRRQRGGAGVRAPQRPRRTTTRRRAKPRKASSTSTRSRSKSGRTTGRKRGSAPRRSTRSRARSSS